MNDWSRTLTIPSVLVPGKVRPSKVPVLPPLPTKHGRLVPPPEHTAFPVIKSIVKSGPSVSVAVGELGGLREVKKLHVIADVVPV